MSSHPEVTLSIVSHGQGAIIHPLLEDCRSFTGASFEILLTLNISEDHSFYEEFTDLPIRIIENKQPRGFGANHNAAFHKSQGEIFMVVNPDIRAPGFDLKQLTSLARMPGVGACAPRVCGADGSLEDSARRFPTISRLFSRVLLDQRIADYDLSGSSPVAVDWVAGMFITFNRATFSQVGGFDERRFFMYLEDADICRRIGNNGGQVFVNPSAQVVHMAQRASRRNLKHMRWHVVSMLRFLTGL
jgi:GT2 family glycosyltransferase